MEKGCPGKVEHEQLEEVHNKNLPNPAPDEMKLEQTISVSSCSSFIAHNV